MRLTYRKGSGPCYSENLLSYISQDFAKEEFAFLSIRTR